MLKMARALGRVRSSGPALLSWVLPQVEDDWLGLGVVTSFQSMQDLTRGSVEEPVPPSQC